MKSDQLLLLQLHPLSHTRELDIRCEHILYTPGDNLYKTELVNIEFNSLRKQLLIGSFKIIPQRSEEAFASIKHYQTDRYDLGLHDIICTDIYLDKLLENKMYAGNISSSKGRILIYRDISKPLDGISKIGNYPHQILLKSSIPINVRHVSLEDLYLEYKEKNVTGKIGTITFTNSRIAISNVTNVPSLLRTGNIADASVVTNVLGNIPISVAFQFFLGDHAGRFNVTGNTGSFNMKSLNAISRTMALIQIDSGFMQNMLFNFSGDDFGTKGNIIMKYNKLRVELLKKNDDGQVSKRGLMSLFANLIIKNENPHNGKLRNFDVQYDRDKNKSFFNLVWKTIFTGMKATVGLPGPKIK